PAPTNGHHLCRPPRRRRGPDDLGPLRHRGVHWDLQGPGRIPPLGWADAPVTTGRHSMESMDPPAPSKAEVSLRVPADGAYVSVLRTMTAGLASRPASTTAR